MCVRFLNTPVLRLLPCRVKSVSKKEILRRFITNQDLISFYSPAFNFFFQFLEFFTNSPLRPWIVLKMGIKNLEILSYGEPTVDTTPRNGTPSL